MNKDYYDQKPVRRIYDFCLGFFGIIIFAALLIYGLSYISNGSYTPMVSIIAVIFVIIASIKIIRKSERIYIGIGMILPIGLVVIAFGGCLPFFIQW